MSFLTSHRLHNAPEDDIEANAADRQRNPDIPTGGYTAGGSGAGAAEGEHIRFGEQIRTAAKSSDLGEFKALDRYITNFDQERRASLASTGRPHKKRKWWQFWKSDAAPETSVSP